MRIISVCLVVLLLLLLVSVRSVGAHSTYQFPQATEGQINEALQKTVPVRFLPSSPLHFLISSKEIVNRFFQPSARERAGFDLVLSGKRLKETYLLLKEGNVKDASSNLKRYTVQLRKMVEQIEKARGQNQDVAALVDRIAEDLRAQETLLFAIDKEYKNFEDSFDFDARFGDAFGSFEAAVRAIDSVRPGLVDRFKSVANEDEEENYVPPSIYPVPSFLFDASPSAKPKRIIY